MQLTATKHICARKLWESVSVDTVAVTLACAEMYNIPELKNSCIDFFAKDGNFKKAALTNGFVQLGLQFPSIIDELRERFGL
jgi:speckle-type POZ protein